MGPLIPNSFLPTIDEITAMEFFKELVPKMKDIFKTKGHDNNSVMVACELCPALPCLFSSVLCISFLCCAMQKTDKAIVGDWLKNIFNCKLVDELANTEEAMANTEEAIANLMAEYFSSSSDVEDDDNDMVITFDFANVIRNLEARNNQDPPGVSPPLSPCLSCLSCRSCLYCLCLTLCCAVLCCVQARMHRLWGRLWCLPTTTSWVCRLLSGSLSPLPLCCAVLCAGEVQEELTRLTSNLGIGPNNEVSPGVSSPVSPACIVYPVCCASLCAVLCRRAGCGA
eukprot:SAG11_NODE_883_length_6737_cov_10.576981_7_plen_283_part_00